jgi:hypothetical protein
LAYFSPPEFEDGSGTWKLPAARQVEKVPMANLELSFAGLDTHYARERGARQQRAAVGCHVDRELAPSGCLSCPSFVKEKGARPGRAVASGV